LLFVPLRDHGRMVVNANTAFVPAYSAAMDFIFISLSILLAKDLRKHQKEKIRITVSMSMGAASEMQMLTSF
jgi:hypothetical protein